MNRTARGLRSASCAGAFALASLLAPAVVHAADATAESLYEEGRHAAAEKNWTLASEKFRASQAREAAPGTLLNLADCEENLGQLVQAEADFNAAAAAFKKGDSRAAYAKKRAAALDPRVSHLSMHFAAGTSADAQAERDGAPVDGSTFGTKVPVDPGQHTVIVHLAGHADARNDFRLAEGETKDIELSAGAPLPAGPPPVAATTPLPAANAPPSSAAAPPPAQSQRADGQTGASNPLIGIGIGSMIVGGAAVGFGLVAGAITLSKKSAVDSDCTGGCRGNYASDESSGKTWSTISTVSVVAGGVLGATGLVLVLVGAKPDHDAATSATGLSVSPTRGGGAFGWSGTF